LGLITSSTDARRAAEESKAFLDYLASRDEVASTGVGVTGYMGGALAFTAVGTCPDRIVALATFHTGCLITDDELSPSRVVPRLKARVLVAGADHDAGYSPEMVEELDRQLAEPTAERPRTELIALFDETLKPTDAMMAFLRGVPDHARATGSSVIWLMKFDHPRFGVPFKRRRMPAARSSSKRIWTSSFARYEPMQR
jgi:dienelactone hydrolase